MLYKFKSRATADLIMLEANGKKLLDIMGKPSQPPGILTVEQIPAAIAALQAAVQAEEAARQAQLEQARANGQEPPEPDPESVQLRQRIVPFIDMLRRSLEGQHEVIW